MYGIKSQSSGKPIKKPWRIATDCRELHNAFHTKYCCGHKDHAPCAGKDTKMTENYSKPMVDLIHKAWKTCAHGITWNKKELANWGISSWDQWHNL